VVCASAISPAFVRGKTWAFTVPGADSTAATLTELIVDVGSDEPLQLGVNESYTLRVNSTHAVITAPTQWGAMYGLESFFQLVLIEPWEQCPNCNKYVLEEHVPFAIEDEPRVRWRGLMIDTGRHYLSPATIKNAIVAIRAANSGPLGTLWRTLLDPLQIGKVRWETLLH
jgi:hypothetical protein